MKQTKLLLVSALAFFCGISVASAQTSIAKWDFSNVAAGTTNTIAASSPAVQGITVSTLTENGGANTIGVVTQPLSNTQPYAGSQTYTGRLYEIGMNTTGYGTVSENSYSLNFSVSVAPDHQLSLSSFVFDLGYDTSNGGTEHLPYFPQARLYVSTDNTTWQAAGDSQSLAADLSTDFSGRGYYLKTGLTVTLSSQSFASLEAGDTLYFRLAISESKNSSTDARRTMLDNITLNGQLTTTTIPEPATVAIIIGALVALATIALRRRR
ncbi:PEP-CTERM sorting domain-containing protein [Geminisphaera colitermitum]|uniref:PEP-CTERM sorting domain-containing protein n=1 Tax=Geminisphaera colitermitum TaxID=1148786 RepID=UPI000158C73F|nr:PEP-CTERM sorting domain-containing protein [Geminisphaera colitermitum]